MNSRLKTETGFTIIEVMVAMLILLLGVLGVATMANQANQVSTISKTRVGATSLARELLEDARTFKYSQLTGNLPAASGPTDLQSAYASAGLTDALPSTPGFQVRRRGITYNVSVFSCVLDDPHDGVRASSGNDVNPAGPYCLGSPAAGSGATTDANPDDARKVEASVTWSLYNLAPSCRGANLTNTSTSAGSGVSCVTQSELIGNPSGGLGPAIDTLAKSTAGPVEGAATQVNMTATTLSPAESMTWNAAGKSGTAAGDSSGSNWTFTWPLGSTLPADGPQLVTAQAFLLNAGGVPKRTAVNLNRFIPAVPTGVTGGIDRRLADAVAVSWVPNSDQDIFGYTVYRASGSAPDLTSVTPDAPVCSTTSVSSTLCFDTPNNLQNLATNAACSDPTAKAAGDVCINYYVVPFDSRWTTLSNPTTYLSTDYCPGLAWGSVTVPAPPVPSSSSTPPITNSSVNPLWSTARAGCPSAFVSIDYTTLSQNHAPDPPASPTCSSDSGQPLIGWTPPASPDQDGDAIVSYRIYRDPPGNSQPNYNDPATTIGFNNGTTSSYRDSADTGGTGHEYWITALDERFQESSALHISWTAGGCP